MNRQKRDIYKRLIAVFCLFAVCLTGFTAYFAMKNAGQVQAAEYTFTDSSGNQVGDGGRIAMRRSRDTFAVLGIQSNDVCTWQSLNSSLVEIENADAAGFKKGGTAVLVVKQVDEQIRDVTVRVTIDHADGTSDIITMTLELTFSINEYLTGVQGVKLEKLYPEDSRKALIMNYGSSVNIGSSTDGNNFLKLIFGNGKEADWVCSNTDVIRYNAVNHVLQAVGAGPATLTVTWTEGTDSCMDTINVYVRPQILSQDGNTILAGGTSDSGSVEVKDGDMIQLTVESDVYPQIAIGDKISWVISKGDGEQSVLVRDSLGNLGQDYEDINLHYFRSNGKSYYRVDAKSGEYNIQFYVKGTYKSFEDSKSSTCACGSVNLKTNVDCDFTDKEVTISLGGTYDLSEAFNIPKDVLREKFTATVLGATGNSIISIDEAEMLVRTKALGNAKLSVKLNASVSTDEIPGFPTGTDTVTVNVTVANTFSLNISETSMAVGSTLSLHGVIGSNAVAEASQFKWSIDGEDYLCFTDEQGKPTEDVRGQYKYVTAKKETPANTHATVTLAWTDSDGVIWVASCVITVNVAATDFMITPDHAEIEVGQSITLHTNIDAQKANIEWISSDTSMLTVSANDGNISAEVTALNKVGTAVITAFNMDNKAYATCVITVTAPITSIRIDKGETYTTTLAEGFVFLKALYEPSNATATDLVWKARNFNVNITDPVATVDANGVVTLLTEGETIITVEPKYNPNRVQAQCIITVKEDPITEIKTDVSELEMVVGDIYQVTTTIKPESPSDPTLNWSVVSGDTVVSVDAEGRITALTAGTAVVMVQGNPRKDGKSPAMATIAVTVRNRLQSIEFADKYVEVEEEGQLQLEVLFTPDDSVNRTLHFASADTDIATVTDDGVVTGVSIGGPVVITCWAEDIGKQSPIQCYVTVVKKKIPATDFDIDPASKTVSVGSSFTINTIFTPENTSDKTVKFASADSSVAKVDANGKVTGVKTGVTAIVCTATQSGLVKSCTVTVVPAVKLRLSPSSREIAKGQSFTIKKIVTPSNANSAATWKSSNSAIASVSSSGKVKGKKLGSCTITCTLTQSGVKATCRVKVAKLRTSIKLNKTNIRIGVGQSYRLKKTISTNASKNPSVKWKSSNKRVASVSSGGKVKGKRVGATKITVTTKDAIKAKASCRVTVIRRVTSVKMSREFATCFVGHTTQLKATVRPKKASIKKLKWTSSDTKIARVSSTGKVTGISAGEVTITAKAKDGSGKKAQCIVRILEETPVSSIVVAQTNMTMKRGDQAKLTYSVLPNNNSDSLSFASDNKRVATVSKSGVVKAVGTGNATITIMSSGGVSATVTVNVVAMNKSSLNMRQYDTETLMVFGTQDTVTWYSSNSRVATVSSSGLVTGRGVGSTYIYAYVNGCKVACKVTITTVNG